MAFFKKYRETRIGLTGPESIKTLSAMERFFQNGKNWTQHAYHRGDGSKCLVGAAQTVNAAPIDDARYWLQRAIAERGVSGLFDIEGFNDSRRSYSEIAEVLARAKQLAAEHSRQRAAAPVAQTLPPAARPALAYQPQDRVEIVTMKDLERVAVKRRE